MKNTPLTLALVSGALATSAQAQLLAHWDYTGFSPDTANHADCLTFSNTLVGVSYSTQQNGSEGTSNYHCFGGWSDSLNTQKYLSYKTTFGANATGSVDTFSFDALNYASGYDLSNHTTEFFVEWRLDGVVQGSYDSATDALDPTLTTHFRNFSIDLNGLDASAGSVAEVRFTAYDVNSSLLYLLTSNPRVGLDNVRLLGSAQCVPEPSTGIFALLSLAGFISRRRR